MKTAAISELKAQLSKYLRLVKSGEKVEIQERGIAIALLVGPEQKSNLMIIPPRKDPKGLKSFQFSFNRKLEQDPVEFLLEDRKKR